LVCAGEVKVVSQPVSFEWVLLLEIEEEDYIPLPGRGGMGILTSLWLSLSRASSSLRSLVSSRAERSDRVRAGWFRAARLRFVGCRAAGTVGPVSGTYAHPGVVFVVVLAISMTPKLSMLEVVGTWNVGCACACAMSK
jgi:hypothetical protein